MGKNTALLYELNSVPLYKQLKIRILDEIKTGNWKRNDKIPSESELSKMFNISRITVRSAVNELAEEGVLLKIQGKGTYVARDDTKKMLTIEVSSFRDFCKQNNLVGELKMVNRYVEEATKSDIEELRLEPGDKVCSITRVLSVDNVPFMIAEDRESEKQFGYLMDLDLEKGSLNESMLLHKDVKSLHSLKRTIEICSATANEAKLLHVPQGFPLLLIRDVTVDQRGRPVRRSKEVIIGNNVRVFYSCQDK